MTHNLTAKMLVKLSWHSQLNTQFGNQTQLNSINSKDLHVHVYGAVSNFHSLFFGWELQLRGNFWQGPISKDTLFENGAKSHISLPDSIKKYMFASFTAFSSDLLTSLDFKNKEKK